MSSVFPPVVVPTLTSSDVDLELLGRNVAERVGIEIKSIDVAGKSELSSPSTPHISADNALLRLYR